MRRSVCEGRKNEKDNEMKFPLKEQMKFAENGWKMMVG